MSADAPAGSSERPARAPFPRSRDRRGRGPRGLLAPRELPLTRSPSQLFDEVVLDAVEHLEERWSEQLRDVDFGVEQVPPDDEPSADGDPVALSRVEPAVPASRGSRGRAARIVIYRRPCEARGFDVEDLADLVLDVVVHDVARLLGLTPEVIDPEGHLPDEG